MPRTVRVNFKSGVLPKPRQVVPVQHTAQELAELARLPSGFEDPRMAPKKSSANPPPRLPKTAGEKIAKSAMEPRSKTAAAASEQAAWKRHIAEVRRSYLKSALLNYEQQEARHAAAREQRRATADAARATKLTEHTETLAEALTTPTIESSLLGEFVRPRSPEEQAELRMKRDHNRKLTAHRTLARRHDQLLQLYQDAASYIVTEDQLEERLQHLFKPEISVPRIGAGLTQNPVWWKYVNNEASRVLSTKEQTRETQLVDALHGTVRTARADHGSERSMPGLKAVRAALKGEE